MARRRRGRSNYKQVKTGTVDLGTAGAQIHIAEIKMIDEALRGSFLNNVQFSVQANNTVYAISPPDPAASVAGVAVMPSFTLYLSYESSSWVDSSVIAVSSTAQGGGNGNLTCKRIIKTNETGSTVAEQIGPVHVWMECTDVTTGATAPTARVTLTAWGRMILLEEDF
jgi:hypothetical protein